MFWSIANTIGASIHVPLASGNIYTKHHLPPSRSNPKAVPSSVYALHLFSRLGAWGGRQCAFQIHIHESQA